MSKDTNKQSTYQNKSAIMVIGRMNPPSKGHIKLIDVAKKQMLRDKYDAVIVMIVAGDETSKDKTKNPLSASERIRYLKNNPTTDGVKFVEVSNVVAGLHSIRDMGFEPIGVVGGSGGSEGKNTADEYKEILDKYFTKNGSKINHKAISVDRDIKDVIGRISSSSMRLAAKNGYYDVFADMAAPVDPETIKSMYMKVKTNMRGEQ